MSDPSTAAELLKAASALDRGIKDAEYNYPAGIIMLLSLPQSNEESRLNGILNFAEEAMLQLAFLNAGENPPSTFIQASYAQGWRFRIDKGFHQVTA